MKHQALLCSKDKVKYEKKNDLKCRLLQFCLAF